MGDYLSELATKNSGTADVIAPRRAAHFEPFQTPLDAPAEPLFFQPESFALEQAFEDERAVIKPDLQPRRTNSRRKDQLIPSRDDAGEQIPQTPLVSTAKKQLPVIKRIERSVPAESKMIEEVRETITGILPSPRPTAPPVVTPKKLPPTFSDVDEEAETTAGHASVKPRFEPKTVELKMPATNSFEPPVSEREIVETQAPIVVEPRVSKSEDRAEETIADQTRFLPPIEKMPKQIAESTPASNVPVINVTIGRIEIRAVTSSAPVKETRPKPPTLSLDEYLRQRSNGGER